MKILIIGNGFLGSAIFEELEAEGHEILIFARTLRPRIQTQQVLGDIFNFEEFAKILDWKPQVIVHTAWITTPGIYRNDPSNTEYANFTASLAKSVINSDIEHLIVLGTCAEYGRQEGPSTAGLTTLSPANLYSQQKVAAFNSIENLFQEADTRLTWARIFYPFGPHQHEKRLIPHLTKSLKNDIPIRLADVSSVYDWITTRDISSAISWMIDHKLPVEVDIGTTIGATNLELLMTLEELLQTKHRVTKQQGHEFGLGEFFVTGKGSPLFMSGWLPKDTLRSGLEWVLAE